MQNKTALVFDIDGTLWDTVDVCTRAWNGRLKELAWEGPLLQPSEIAGIMGLAFEQVAAKLFPYVPKQRGLEIFQECLNAHVPMLEREGAELYSGVKAGLESLSKKFALAVVSNCTEEYLRVFLNKTTLGPLFIDSECHGRTKLPKGDSLTMLLKRNSFGEAFYIGDTEGDAKAAKQAGVKFCFVSYGFGSSSEYHKTFASFPELVLYFDQLARAQ